MGQIFSICLVATLANRAMVFYCYGNAISFSPYTLFWIWCTITPDLLVLLILYILLFHIGWKYPQLSKYSIGFGICFAAFTLLVSSVNILMLTITGQNLQWKIVFEVDLATTYSLYQPQTLSFVILLVSYLFVGSAIWFLFCREIQRHNILRFGRLFRLKTTVLGFISTYTLIVFVFHIPQPYKNLSTNIVLSYFPEIIEYYWSKMLFIPFHMEESAFNAIGQIIRAPIVNISLPVVTLKKPIKHVFIIILESIRADALPLNESLASAVRSTFTPDTTAEDVTPFLNSLWMKSLRTVASVTTSYTLKSLISMFCGIYPLNVNFLREITLGNVLYEKCLPDLLRDTFQTTDNQSAFRSAFFTAARDDFDRQRDLFIKLNFNTVINAYDIYEQIGILPDLGMFGPADPYILPPMWQWIDKNLAEQKTPHLMMSLLLTGTHTPFPMAENSSIQNYRYYINHAEVNNYLNTIRTSDKFVKEIIDGFKSRKIHDNTLFVIVSDHGYVFNDYGRETSGLLNAPLESALLVPLMFYNPHLEAKQLYGQFTNMDVLPTIMDILLSSMKPVRRSSNRLLSVPKRQLKLILSQYEGTSILRMPIERQSVRHTFHLANPGDSVIIVKQYPRKLTYDSITDEVHLYHLTYDPYELTDLIALDYDNTDTYPIWLDKTRNLQWTRTWKGRWTAERTSITAYNQILSANESFVSTSELNTKLDGKVKLNDMLDWADRAFELARLWKELIKLRYLYGRKTFNISETKNQESYSTRNDFSI